MAVTELILVFTLGSVIYGAIEIIFRGRTHWSMLLVGGVCFSFLYYITTRTEWPLLILCLAGAFWITLLELAVGYVVNIRLGLSVWDYSKRKGNFLGQICPAFSACWFLLCIPGVGLSRLIFARFMLL